MCTTHITANTQTNPNKLDYNATDKESIVTLMKSSMYSYSYSAFVFRITWQKLNDDFGVLWNNRLWMEAMNLLGLLHNGHCINTELFYSNDSSGSYNLIYDN